MATKNAVVKSAKFSDEELSSVKSFEDALATVASVSEGVLEQIGDYGNGFIVLKDKDALVGVPFIVMAWTFHPSEFKDENNLPTEFVSAYVVTKNDEKWVLNDGSTGIRDQLAKVTSKRIESGDEVNAFRGLACPQGLSKSEYTYVDDKGREIPAKTYYLS